MSRTILALLVGICLTWGHAARAWEAHAFEGEGADAVREDLLPRSSSSGEAFYSEDYGFDFRLEDKSFVSLQLGMSNVLGGKGSAFVKAAVKVPGVKRRSVKKTVEKGAWSFDKEPFKLDIGGVRLFGDHKQMRVAWEITGVEVSLELKAEVPGWRPGSGKVDLGENGFVEIVVWPKMAVTGTVKEKKTGKTVKVKGVCMLTHSASTVSPALMPPRWFYFKGGSASDPVLLQAVDLGEAFGGKVVGWMLAVEGSKVVARSNSLGISAVDVKEVKPGVKVPWAIYMKDDAAGLEGAVKGEKFHKEVDRLRHLSKLQAALVRKLINPVRYVFAGRMELKTKAGKTFKFQGSYKVETVR